MSTGTSEEQPQPASEERRRGPTRTTAQELIIGQAGKVTVNLGPLLVIMGAALSHSGGNGPDVSDMFDVLFDESDDD